MKIVKHLHEVARVGWKRESDSFEHIFEIIENGIGTNRFIYVESPEEDFVALKRYRISIEEQVN